VGRVPHQLDGSQSGCGYFGLVVSQKIVVKKIKVGRNGCVRSESVILKKGGKKHSCRRILRGG